MNQPILERETVDEGLERGAGRAQRLGHVDLAGAALVEVVGARDAREHLAGRIVHRDDRHRNVGPERAGALACKLFERLLHVRVDRERDHLAALRCSDRLIGGMRREHRHRPASTMHALGFREDDLVGRHAVRLRDAVEHAVARALGDFRQTVGTARLGRLRDRDQQCGFAEREPSRLLAEIGMRGGAHAFEIAAIRRKRRDRA